MPLDEIVQAKRQEVENLKLLYGSRDLEALSRNIPKPHGFLSKGTFSLIAEVKKASPSAGVIIADYDPTAIARAYERAGAAAISVLTDEKYFQGKLAHIFKVKEAVKVPILRKDFILDELQVYETRMSGADALLLIVRLLDKERLKTLLALTEKLGMQALVEVHNADEVKIALESGAGIIGINNRDLDTLKTDIRNTLFLLKQFPELKERIIISESGIKSAAEVKMLRGAGVDGILVGETLLKAQDAGEKITELLS